LYFVSICGKIAVGNARAAIGKTAGPVKEILLIFRLERSPYFSYPNGETNRLSCLTCSASFTENTA
jgi:hypothetical protein